MRDITPETLVGRLDEVWRAAVDQGDRPILAFDADGTLWAGDVGDDFFEALLANGDVLSPVEDVILRELEQHRAPGGAPFVKPNGLASRALFDAYHAGRFDEERFYEIVAWAAAGRTRSEVEAYADRVQNERGLDARLHAEVKPVLEWAHSAGIDVFVASASPRIVVQRGAKRLGIDPDHVFGAQAAFDGETMLPDAVRPIPYGPGKVTALRSRIGDRAILAAFGDNAFDLPMLQASSCPVVIRPKPRLLGFPQEIASFYRLSAPM